MIADYPTLADQDGVSQHPAGSLEPAISVRAVGKMYRMYDRPEDRLKHMLLWRFGRRYGREFWAVRGVSLDVGKGETVGIIGRNGSGKSTLLQIIAGTLAPNEGEVRINGRVTALLELGSGFNPQFTGRENVFLNGAVLGCSHEEMAERFDSIVAFADIGAFIDQPVKTYSSGMVVRLAFAVQSHVAPDVLIVDEALSVGDIFFQQKCFAHIRSLQQRGVTILYVSHDLNSVQNICDRAILMKDGAAVFDGDPNEAVNRYYRVLGEQAGPRGVIRPAAQNGTAGGATLDPQELVRHTILRADGARHGDRMLELVAARVCDDAGQDTLTVMMLGALRFCVLLKANQPVEAPNLGMHLYDRFGNLIFAIGSAQLSQDLPSLDTGDYMAVCIRVELRVQPGQYTFNLVAGELVLGDNPNIGFVHDNHELLGPLTVQRLPGLLPFYGAAQLPATAEYEFKGHV